MRVRMSGVIRGGGGDSHWGHQEGFLEKEALSI